PILDAASADFNGDGNPDLVVTSISNKVQVLLGEGNGLFGLAQSLDVPGVPSFVATGDLDGDGDQDFVVVRAETAAVQAFMNDGAGGFSAGATAPIGAAPQELTVGDVDGDGVPDVGPTGPHGRAADYLRGRGDGTFEVGPGMAMPADAQPLGIAIADVDGDGRADVLATDHAGARIGVFWGRPGGGYDLTMHDVDASPVAVTVGDVTHDGLP